MSGMRSELDRSIAVLLAVSLVILTIFLTNNAMSVEPNGANITAGTSERAQADNAGSAQAQAGNVTQLNIYGYSTTQSWQGYFGNVTGTIQLGDASGNTLYNWTLANPQGEVYASTNQSITWTNIQCFNYTATGSGVDESGNGGSINLFGTNLTTLEDRFNINYSDVDGIDETFTLQHGGNGEHDQFYTAHNEFAEGECISTRVFDSSGQGVNDNFEEVLLYEPSTFSVVYAALLEPESLAGFDGSDYDFQMLVPEDGHGTDVDTTTYYFFVELE
jgi:hypothetical protein